MRHHKFEGSDIKQQMWEFRMVGNTTFDDCVVIIYRYQENQESWDPASLYILSNFDVACGFVNARLKELRKDFKQELLQIALHPDRLPWVLEHDHPAVLAHR